MPVRLPERATGCAGAGRPCRKPGHCGGVLARLFDARSCPKFGWRRRPWGMTLQALILLLGVCLFAIVAYYDIRTRRIPNEFIVGILALSSFRIALAGNP